MIRPTLFAAALMLPLLAGAQAIKCRDPATGRTLYTDQPCKGGELVVPARTEEDVRRDAEAAVQARENAALRREQAALERERQQMQAAQAAQAAQASARAPQPPAESEACRAARAEASFRAASFAAGAEEIRTARYNAALACGQPPPADVVVVPPYYGPPGYVRPRPPRYEEPRPPHGGGFGVPVQRPRPSRPDPRDEPIPVRVLPPGATR